MGDPSKCYPPPRPSKLNLLVYGYETKKTMAFVYGFMATFVICILLILLSDPYGHSFSPSSSSSSPDSYFKEASRTSHLFPNTSQFLATHHQNTSSALFTLPQNGTQPRKSNGLGGLPSVNNTVVVMNQTGTGQVSESFSVGIKKEIGGLRDQQNITNSTSADVGANSTSADVGAGSNGMELYEHEAMLKCDFYDGNWVRDYSYPLYPHGSCSSIDKSFNCFRNGRPDSDYESYRWQPNHCNIPRLKGENMLESIRGKRLVFVGDSLNRNMWESLVCILKNSVEDQSRVVRSFTRLEFKDYNCSVEFYWSAFLVQEWETPNRDGSKKKTLRLDLMDKSTDKYKDADILVFNSGHWYNHEKTSNGRKYYQEGNRIYRKLNVVEAYRRALITWRKWVDANVNPMNTQVFFRGYSAAHFGGGKWNSGGRCDKQTTPIKKKKYLSKYPVKMKILESVMKGMKTPVHFMNITRLTDYRKDAHPAAYRTLNSSKEERLNPPRFQDCSHWCLPGVPDTWNEILYAQILINYYKNHKHKTTK